MTAAAPLSIRSVVLEQSERTRESSKADIQRFIEAIELKITSLDSQISALVELRGRERACVAALKYLISPIHTLPVELLAEVFELAIDDETHVKDVFRICHVCSDWRQVAHGTPRLWTRPIQLDIRKNRHYTDGLNEWLAHSEPFSVPVSLAVQSTSNIDYRILEEVLRTAPRWHSFEMQLPREPTPLPLVRALAQSRLDSLEELSLGSIRVRQSSNLGSIISFTTVPRLRKLTIGIYSAVLPILTLWVQLTHLTLHCDPSDTVLNILAHCANLITASVKTSGWYFFPQRQDIIPLDQLRTLRLSSSEFAGHAIPFWDSLSTPALEELCLHSPRLWRESHFTAFQLRAPNITRLELKESNLTSAQLQAAIRHAPSITHLKLIRCQNCIDDAFILALFCKDGVEPLGPRLHNLVLAGIDVGIDGNVGDNILAGMISSRWWTDAELASQATVSPAVARWTLVELWGDFSEYFVDVMEDLQRQGIPVRFFGDDESSSES